MLMVVSSATVQCDFVSKVAELEHREGELSESGWHTHAMVVGRSIAIAWSELVPYTLYTKWIYADWWPRREKQLL